MSLIGLMLVLAGCSDIPLNLVKGNGVTSAGQFNHYDKLDERTKLRYYEPFSLRKNTALPEEIEALKVVVPTTKLPFHVDEEIGNLVAFKDHNGDRKYELQQSYVNYDDYGEISSFYTIAAIQSTDNPLKNVDIQTDKDLIGNELIQEMLPGDIPFFGQRLTTDSALIYTYYTYDKESNKVSTTATAANEFYTYKDGIIYHIGYLMDEEKSSENTYEQLAELTKEVIFQ